MSDEPKKRSRAWIGWAAAIGLLPLSLLMAPFGFNGAFGPQEALWTQLTLLALILSPFVALIGVIWILVLIVLADRRHAARSPVPIPNFRPGCDPPA